uniref:Uncharacterized protein n=1 Tax=Mesocestoides corti TaxID=53468 RepID=A0A5K3G1L0_MESCO
MPHTLKRVTFWSTHLQISIKPLMFLRRTGPVKVISRSSLLGGQWCQPAPSELQEGVSSQKSASLALPLLFSQAHPMQCFNRAHTLASVGVFMAAKDRRSFACLHVSM